MISRARRRIEGSGRARVLIHLSRSDGVSEAQERVLEALGGELELIYRYDRVAALAGVLTRAGLALALADPRVRSLKLDEPGSGQLAESVPLIGAAAAQALGVTGAGVRIAVLDTGVDTDHPDLSDDIVAQHCFNNADCPPNDTNEGTSAEDEHGHGTFTTSIITSKGVVAPAGVAPDAEIVAVRVLDSNNIGPPSQWLAGLDWVLTNLATLDVRVINMSLSSWSLHAGSCDASYPSLTSAIAQLAAQGVLIFASTGNNGSSDSVSAPACINGVVAVGATYDADLGRQPASGAYDLPGGGSCFDQTTGPSVIGCFTNSSASMDLLAPGAVITSSALGGGSAANIGTSLAAPAAAAAAALLLQCSPALDPAAVETALTQSGPPRTDPKNGLQFPSLDVLSAITSRCPCAGKPDGDPCDDGDGCTEPDSCQAGRCESGAPVVCAAQDQCHVAGVCDPASGLCSNPLAPDDAPCDDGDACTKTDACQAGACVGGDPLTCAPQGQCHEAGTCEPATGTCSSPAKALGTPCADGDPCTRDDACDGAGACTGSAYACEPASCEASATCDGAGGCVRTALPDGAPCDDGDPCTAEDSCKQGACVSGAPVVCQAEDECRAAGSCDPSSGSCTAPPKPDRTPCTGGSCVDGVCVSAADSGPDADSGDGAVEQDGCSCTLGSSEPALLILCLLFARAIRRRRP